MGETVKLIYIFWQACKLGGEEKKLGARSSNILSLNRVSQGIEYCLIKQEKKTLDQSPM